MMKVLPVLLKAWDEDLINVLKTELFNYTGLYLNKIISSFITVGKKWSV